MTSPQSTAKGSSDIRTLFEMLISEFYLTQTFNEIAEVSELMNFA